MIIGRTFTVLILIINRGNWFKNMPSWLKDALITRNKYCQSNHVIVSWKVYHSFIFFLKDHEPNELIKLWSDHPAYTIRFFLSWKTRWVVSIQLIQYCNISCRDACHCSCFMFSLNCTSVLINCLLFIHFVLARKALSQAPDKICLRLLKPERKRGRMCQ